jgi:hypothetical protein
MDPAIIDVVADEDSCKKKADKKEIAMEAESKATDPHIVSLVHVCFRLNEPHIHQLCVVLATAEHMLQNSVYCYHHLYRRRTVDARRTHSTGNHMSRSQRQHETPRRWGQTAQIEA